MIQTRIVQRAVRGSIPLSTQPPPPNLSSIIKLNQIKLEKLEGNMQGVAE